jgi:hypothetical protein
MRKSAKQDWNPPDITVLFNIYYEKQILSINPVVRERLDKKAQNLIRFWALCWCGRDWTTQRLIELNTIKQDYKEVY